MTQVVASESARRSSDPATPTTRRVLWPWLDFYRRPPMVTVIALGLLGWAGLVLLWQLLSWAGWVSPLLLPPPWAVLTTAIDMLAQGDFLSDIGASITRIAVSFAIACLIAVPLGLLMGALPVVDAVLGPLASAWRYLPATAFIPLLLMWFGPTDSQKIALLILGVIWFLLVLVADHTRQVPRELIETSKTLGATRRQIFFTVILPAAWPGVVDIMRQMLAISWTYLVIAEIVAATDGIGAVMMRAQRFVRTEEIMVGIVVIGLLGIFSDSLFRLAHRLLFPYLYKGRGSRE